MKSKQMGMLLLLSAGMVQAAQPELERPRQAQTLQAMEATPPRSTRPQASPVRKAEMTRRLFWLALSLR